MTKQLVFWASIASIVGVVLAFLAFFPPSGTTNSHTTAGPNSPIVSSQGNSSPPVLNQGSGTVEVRIYQPEKSQDKFFEAIRIGDLATINSYIQGGMNLHANADDRQMPIHLSKNTTNTVEVLNLLRNNGLDLNYSFYNQRTTGPQENRLLFWATASENKTLVDELLKHGADPNFETEIRGAGAPIKLSLLRYAEQNAKPLSSSQAARDILQTLISRGAKLSAQEVERQQVPTAAEVEHRLKICTEEMNRTPPTKWIEEASHFNILKSEPYSVREAILAELNVALLTGSITDSNARAVLTKAIDKNCRSYRAA